MSPSRWRNPGVVPTTASVFAWRPLTRWGLRLALLAVAATATACCASRSAAPTPAAAEATRTTFHQEFLPHPQAPGKRIEFYWMTPQGQGPWPMVVHVHGHQMGGPGQQRPGAGAMEVQDWLKRMAGRGALAVAISQPGYGRSDGPPDYSGPLSQGAVREVLRYFRQKAEVRADRVALYGASRGAGVVAMVASSEPGLAAVVLNVGLYDLKASHEALQASSDSRHRQIAENIAREAGTSEQSFQERSALSVVDRMRSPTLILTAEHDFPGSNAQAKQLAAELERRKVPVKLVEFPGQGHMIPLELKDPEVERFLREHLLREGTSAAR